jgi:hypothetical protein
MISVDTQALPLLLDAADRELRRLKAVRAAVGDDWPTDFDANDIPIFEIIVSATAEAVRTHSSKLDLAGKTLWFLLDLLPAYVQENAVRLSFEQYQALKHVYASQLEGRKVAFPAFNA